MGACVEPMGTVLISKAILVVTIGLPNVEPVIVVGCFAILDHVPPIHEPCAAVFEIVKQDSLDDDSFTICDIHAPISCIDWGDIIVSARDADCRISRWRNPAFITL